MAILPPGTKLDRFVIKQHLGSGSLGDVYLARDLVREEDEDVAIKVVDIGPCSPRAAARQLQRERAVYDKIQDHRNVLKIHDIHLVLSGGTSLLILSMEYAEGGTFREWLEAHRNDWETRKTEGLAWFKQICLGVAACHDAGVTLLDLKPENCLFVRGVLKVSDFNVSGLVQNLTVGRSSALEDTVEEPAFGTPVYMSPEHFSAAHPDDLDARADIYSLGVILHEILHPKARPPFGGSFARLRELHTQMQPPPLPGADPAEARVVARCLEKDPAKRYQSVDALLDDLEGRTPSPVDDLGDADDAAGDVDTLWEEICCSVEKGELNAARQLCRRLLQRVPDHVEAKELLEELQERHQRAARLYAAIEQGLGSRSLDELDALLTEAMEAYPDHPSGHAAQVSLGVRVQQYLQATRDALAAVRRRDWAAAQSWIEMARGVNPGARETEGPARVLGKVLQQIEETRRRIDEVAAAGNWRRAEDLAQGLDEYLDGLSEAAMPVEGDDDR
jgi:serine/threonine-protein kinase